MKNIERWIVPIVGGCFAFILVLMTMDFVVKHYLYLQQRDIMFHLIRGSEEYEAVKKTVSYLQGAATRRINQIIQTSLYFGLSFITIKISVFKRGDKS